ncbi:MAG: DUF6624 domain-containing protein [Candidatus Paceibacterota bacterium]
MTKNRETKIKYSKERDDLLKMMREDQELAQKTDVSSKNKELDDEFKKTNKRHRTKLKQIINKIGWPTIDKVGRNGSQAAWLLVQHSDEDIKFQKKCLKLLKENKDSVNEADIAYLTDRVLKNENKPQLYGTQLKQDDNGNLVPFLIKNKDKVDSRRSKVGLDTLSNYLKKVNNQKDK